MSERQAAAGKSETAGALRPCHVACSGIVGSPGEGTL